MDHGRPDYRIVAAAETCSPRELYTSSSGDRWLLLRDSGSGRVSVRHEPNLASGGRAVEFEIGDFLTRGGQGPEHQALLYLIGTLVEDQPGG